MAKATNVARAKASLNDDEEIVQDVQQSTPSEHYEEWRCEVKVETKEGTIVGRKIEKLRKLRAVVKITEEQAETLNHSALYSPRRDYVIAYFRPGSDEL
jgi:hypothetical protein